MSSEFWSTVSVVGVASLAMFSKHFRFFVLHFFKGVNKSTKSKPKRK